jgi:signal transduction histidine kinase
MSEVALRNGIDPQGSRDALGTVRDVAGRMGRSISTLLKLARLEMGDEHFARQPVDLFQLVQETLRAHAHLQRERQLRVENSVRHGEQVAADPEVLRIVLANLVSNAFYYSPEGGSIQLDLGFRRDDWCLFVENEAPELREEDLEALSAPFWRKDPSRTDGNRSGLGLALSCALAERSSLRLHFSLVDGRFRGSVSGRLRDRGVPAAARNGAHTTNGHRG